MKSFLFFVIIFCGNCSLHSDRLEKMPQPRTFHILGSANILSLHLHTLIHLSPDIILFMRLLAVVSTVVIHPSNSSRYFREYDESSLSFLIHFSIFYLTTENGKEKYTFPKKYKLRVEFLNNEMLEWIEIENRTLPWCRTILFFNNESFRRNNCWKYLH